MFKRYNIEKIYTLAMCNKKQKPLYGFENIDEVYPESKHNIEEISEEEFRIVYPSLRALKRMQIIPLDYLKPISSLLKKKRKLYVISGH